MTATMRLAVEGCEATFDPADGGRLSSFRVGDHELLVTRGKDVFHSGSFVIAPWVGRLRDAVLNYGAPCTASPPTAGHTPCTGSSLIGRGRSLATANLASNSTTHGLGRAGWFSELYSPRAGRRSASKCMRAWTCQQRSGGILGLSAAWRERPPPLHSNSTWSRDLCGPTILPACPAAS